jgi:hypothetical protein
METLELSALERRNYRTGVEDGFSDISLGVFVLTGMQVSGVAIMASGLSALASSVRRFPGHHGGGPGA